MKSLGGMRKLTNPDSKYKELGKESFIAFREFMDSEEFEKSIDQVINLAEQKVIAIMCSEKDYLKCHRQFIAGYLVDKGGEVMNI